jgi:Bifunctional DNA primase/polymerase, N-terminal
VSHPFGAEAEHYWQRNLSALPIEPGTKQPARGLRNWTSYCSNLPKPETQASWLRAYAHCGLGLGLGHEVIPGYRIAAVDVDDDDFVRLATVIVGGDAASKVGKKGRTLFVVVPSGDKIKSTKLLDAEKRGAIDFLFNGRMTLLPPSLHPETRQPYKWTSGSLLDVELSTLPVFNSQKLAILRLVVSSRNALVLLTGNSTHEPGLRLTAELVASGCKDELVREIVISLLPTNYTGNSLDELSEWIESARRKGFDRGADLQQSKKSASDKLIELFEQSGAALFHDEGRRGYMTIAAGNGRRNYPIHSTDASLWLGKLYYDAFRKAIGERPMEEAIRLLEARARFDTPQLAVSLRVGGDASSEIAVDLGREDGLLVAVKDGSWSLEYDAAIKLIRSPGFGELPLPTATGDLDKLKHLLGLDNQNWTLVLAFLLLCLRPNGPYMLLLVEGEQGSGKSFLCSTIKLIIDPNQVEKARLPETQRDLMIHAKDYFLLVFDNVSGMKGDLSDALCVLATGGGFATRKLYTDDELFVFNFCRPVIINGIADFVNRPDLLERSIPLRLPSIEEGARKTEQEMLEEFRIILPGILSCLYTIVAKALANPVSAAAALRLRMADCERWLVACEPFTGLARGSFINAIKASQDEIFVDRAQNDQIVGALVGLLKLGAFKGTVLELHERLKPIEWSGLRQFPATASHLSRHLARQRPAMAKMGIFVELGPRTRDGRVIHIWKDGERDKLAPEPEPGPGY